MIYFIFSSWRMRTGKLHSNWRRKKKKKVLGNLNFRKKIKFDLKIDLKCSFQSKTVNPRILKTLKASLTPLLARQCHGCAFFEM